VLAVAVHNLDDVFPLWLPLDPAPASEQRPCRGNREADRERDQRVPEVLSALELRPGSVVADVGAGGGFYTVRLARAVGDGGQVFAVDIDRQSLQKLEARVDDEGLGNVRVIEGAPDDPRLPAAQLDAALIVNAYHEMKAHQEMLQHLRRALKPGGRLVILEPISPSRRTATREAQARSHEIAAEFVLQDARDAGYKILRLEEPFSRHQGHGVEWLMVLTPAADAVPPPACRDEQNDFGDPDGAGLRISMEDFRRLVLPSR
jgi:SAM-dependent methyltransferase